MILQRNSLLRIPHSSHMLTMLSFVFQRNMHHVFVSAVSFDSRRHNQNALQWKTGSIKEGVHVQIGLLRGDGLAVATAAPLPLTSFTQVHLRIPAAEYESASLVVSLNDSNQIEIAKGSIALKDHAEESLCGELNQKGGRFVVDLGDVASIILESVSITPFNHPLANVPSNTRLSTGSTILVGHRGIGMNKVLFIEGSGLPQISENTCESFLEAYREGVQFVEFDAQVTKDLKVVLYHDSIVSEIEAHTEIKDLTEAEFLSLKPRLGTQPFTTLATALKTLPHGLGFNIEIKYPMPDEIDSDNLRTIEFNTFVDAILETTFAHAGVRKIVFSCFHPEVARMTKLKQSRYPVLFLTMGGTTPTLDLRSNTFLAAAEFANLAQLDGIVSDATPVVQNPYKTIKAAKEMMGEGRDAVFTYGSQNCIPRNAKALKDAGLDGIIVDKVVQVREELKGE